MNKKPSAHWQGLGSFFGCIQTYCPPFCFQASVLVCGCAICHSDLGVWRGAKTFHQTLPWKWVLIWFLRLCLSTSTDSWFLINFFLPLQAGGIRTCIIKATLLPKPPSCTLGIFFTFWLHLGDGCSRDLSKCRKRRQKTIWKILTEVWYFQAEIQLFIYDLHLYIHLLIQKYVNFKGRTTCLYVYKVHSH